MYKRLILKNIHLLNFNILKGLLENKNIFLSDDDAIVVCNVIKENSNDLINGNYKDSFDLLKSKIDSNNYQLIYNLYFDMINKI